MTREALEIPRPTPSTKASGDFQLQSKVPAYTPSHQRRPKLKWIVLAVVVVIVVALTWWLMRRGGTSTGADGKGGPPGGARAIPVVAVTARKGELPIYVNGLGTVTALNTVTLRSRVDGELQEVHFVEGQTVKAGDLLAQIDPRPYEASLAQAQGQLARDQATLNNARTELTRDREAAEALPKQTVDTQQALVRQYEGGLKVDEAMVQSAQLQVDYSKIYSPITGRIGLKLVDVGNMIHSNDATGLVVITQIQPISVIFTLPQDDIPRLTQRLTQGTPPPVDAYNRDLSVKISTGTLLALDSSVDPSSGTIRLKATFPNDDVALYPNQFVNARLLVNTLKDVVLVSAAAVQRGPDKTFAYVVTADETVDIRDIVVGAIEGDTASIESGLKPGDIVVTDGVDKLIKGAKVAVRKGGGTTKPAGAGGMQGGGPGGPRRPTSGPATQPVTESAAAPTAHRSRRPEGE